MVGSYRHIVVGSDGNLWFTLYHGMVLGNITVNGRVTLYRDLVYPSDGHDFDPVSVIVRDLRIASSTTSARPDRIARVTIPR